MIRRSIFNVAAAMSLLLFLATLALMVICFDRSASYVWVDPDHARVEAVYLDDYRVGCLKKETDFVPPRPGRHYSDFVLVSWYPAGWNRGVPPIVIKPADDHEFLGFAWGESHLPEWVIAGALDSVTSVTTVWLEVPLLLFAVLPVVYVGKIWNARRRRRHRLCPACIHNFAADADGVCPECGMAEVQNKESDL